MNKRKVIKATNQLIYVVERVLAFILAFIWIPAFIKPPEGEGVYFLTLGGYTLSGAYTHGTYRHYPAKYDRIYAWRFRHGVSLPKLKLPKTNEFSIEVLLGPKSDHVWEYVDGNGEQHWVTANTRKALEKNPFHTTIGEKNEKLQKSSEKAKEKRFEQIKKIKGNNL